MAYPSKTYKVYPLFQVMYYSIYEVLDRNKPQLLNCYLDRVVGENERVNLSRFLFQELFTDMVDQFEKALQETEYDDLIFKIDTNERTVNLRKAYNNTSAAPNILIGINFRISPDTISRVKRMKRETLTEIIEKIITHYLTLLTEVEFKLVNEVFEKYLSSRKLFT